MAAHLTRTATISANMALPLKIGMFGGGTVGGGEKSQENKDTIWKILQSFAAQSGDLL